MTTVLSYGILVLLGYLVFLIVEPFAAPLAWSAIFCIFFYPVYEKLEKRSLPTAAALICTVGVTLLLILPALFVLLYAAREAIDASARLRTFVSGGGATLPTDFASRIRQHLPESLQDVDFVGPLRQAAERIASYLASSLGAMLKNLLSFFVNLFILLFTLFFMFRDGKKIMRAVRHLIPFERDL